jgi:catechol 2,3-dioxygenase-like lactoylglutathione lyase family enzyme
MSSALRAAPRGSARLAIVQPLGIHHVSINVHDTGAAVEFYTGVLGLTLRSDRPDFGFGGAWLDLAGQQVHLLELAVPEDRGQHFAIAVADLDAAVQELRARGVDVADPKSVGTGRQAFVRDPSGNLVELNEPANT